MSLQPNQFASFFQELYPYPPMTWQVELAEAACKGDWPGYVCLPTGSGKTSTIDIALFALAFQADRPPEERTAAMRTFLVVDRRTVVSEACYRAQQLQRMLSEATDGILKVVADRLRSYSDGNASPLKVVELRGGIYRDPGWCDSLTQPMIVTSTVDQVGSRLLFRGYGVSHSARPIQAAAVAHDSLIILDEAHISPAFSETLAYVKTYQDAPWSAGQVPLPLRLVEMTATPPAGSDATRLEIGKTELEDPSTHIGRIVNTPKLAQLEVAEKVKGARAPSQLATVMVAKAIESVNLDPKPKNEIESVPESTSQAVPEEVTRVVGVICNMVATAKEVHSQLIKNKKIDASQVHLVIGAMRPIDRDTQTDELRRLISTGSNRADITRPVFVVATQCIEVGADYDFDVLVTEAAPLDSLVQRFGRLNRGGRSIKATAHIIMRGDRVRDDQQLEADAKAFKPVDPIYGNAMSHSWNWLVEVAKDEIVDFGIASLKKSTSTIGSQRRKQMSTGDSHAPVLLPAHLDLLCQTSADPWPDPDVSLWLHGPQRNDPAVQVCWRADLLTLDRIPSDGSDPVLVQSPKSEITEQKDTLIHALSLCPPSSAECLSIPMRRVCAWLAALAKDKKVGSDLTADVSAIVEETSSVNEPIPAPFRPVAWRGLDKSEVVEEVKDIRPGDTLVFPVTAGGWSELGFIPEVNDWKPKSEIRTDERTTVVEYEPADFQKLAGVDCGSVAYGRSRNRPVLRVHPSLISTPEARGIFKQLNENPNWSISKSDLCDLVMRLSDESRADFADVDPSQLRYEMYADRSGIVITGPRRTANEEVVLAEDDGSDVYSRSLAGKRIELSDHLQHVRSKVAASLSKLSLSEFSDVLLRAAEVHDWGKVDPRFQALLLGGDLYSALWEDKLYAKSASMATSLRERNNAMMRSELPKSFRHEFLSVSLFETTASDSVAADRLGLLLHLIASHHGHARPWAPICDDPVPPAVTLENIGLGDVALSESDRKAICYHRVDSALINRFWDTIGQYGWWGTAFLESVLRLADRKASQIESQLQTSRATKDVQTIQAIEGVNA